MTDLKAHNFRLHTSQLHQALKSSSQVKILKMSLICKNLHWALRIAFVGKEVTEKIDYNEGLILIII